MYRSSEKEEESCCLMYIFTSSTKHEIRHLIIIFQVLGAVMAKKCTKMCNTCAKLLFCQSKPIAFMPFLLTSPLSLLKLPIVLCTQLLIWTQRFICLLLGGRPPFLCCHLRHAKVQLFECRAKPVPSSTVI